MQLRAYLAPGIAASKSGQSRSGWCRLAPVRFCDASDRVSTSAE
jgi:hypothetical protein